MRTDPRELLRVLEGSEDGRVLLEIARAVRRAGGRGVVVGGWVRDALLGQPSKDLDLEVHGLGLPELERLLSHFGSVHRVGRSFGVLRVSGIGVDVTLPRRDSKVAPGHRGFEVEIDPAMGFEEASRRRDLRINSVGLDPLTGELLDPHGGLEDLRTRRLRATDPSHFGEDPLRGLRVAQFAARFEMEPDAELLALCAALDLSELAAERVFEELRKLLEKGVRPSLGLAFLKQSGLLRFFPELAAMVDVPQDPRWHPEGDVWVHTLMALDCAAALRQGSEDRDSALMWGVLCHDLGKPATTAEMDGRIRSLGHEEAGVAPTRALLERLRAPSLLVERCVLLVRYHLAPAHFEKGDASDRAYRRLARKLATAGLALEDLERVARSDHLGRTTEAARAGCFAAGDTFLRRAAELAVSEAPPRDAVQGRHLIARGLSPGPLFGEILEACRELQDTTGERDPDILLDRVLAQRAAH